MTEKKLGALRRRARQLGTGHSRRYTLTLRTDVTSAVASLRAAGWTWKRLADELGISIETLRRWWQDDERASRPALQPVEVQRDTGVVLGGITIMTPAGLRVEGLGVDEAAQLIRALL